MSGVDCDGTEELHSCNAGKGHSLARGRRGKGNLKTLTFCVVQSMSWLAAGGEVWHIGLIFLPAKILRTLTMFIDSGSLSQLQCHTNKKSCLFSYFAL